MIHTPLTRLIEFVAAIPDMVAPNVLPRGQPMPCAITPTRRPAPTAPVWKVYGGKSKCADSANDPSRAGGLKTPAQLPGDR